ncbi:hypothetical protein D3C85_1931250 [compost metagenome]
MAPHNSVRSEYDVNGDLTKRVIEMTVAPLSFAFLATSIVSLVEPEYEMITATSRLVINGADII